MSMEFFAEFQEWLRIGTIAIVSAALGFFGCWYLHFLHKKKTKKNIAITKLELLKTLLDESKNVSEIQSIKVKELFSSIAERYGEEFPNDIGYDRAFYQTYDQMKNEEKELFHVIRGTTIHSVYRLNEELREWTDTYTAKKLSGLSTVNVESLDRKLMQLRLNLNGWFAKYEAIIKTSEKRSLVYLTDKKKLGFGYPNNIRKEIELVLGEIKDGKIR